MVGGDPKAKFDIIVAPHLSDAFAFARWLAGNRADAEDIVQDSCLRAFRAIDTYAGGNARAWILTIVRHTAYSWLKKNRSLRFVAMDDLNPNDSIMVERGGANLDEGTHKGPEAELIAKVETSELEAAISKLPTEFREIIVLRDINGIGYREIAEITSVPIGTVMSRLSRGRQRLIEMLGTQVR
jgi:RNA polymerase sigma factor (sigma-70 family)